MNLAPVITTILDLILGLGKPPWPYTRNQKSSPDLRKPDIKSSMTVKTNAKFMIASSCIWYKAQLGCAMPDKKAHVVLAMPISYN